MRLLAQGEAWKRELETGKVKNKARLGMREGCSGHWVAQVVRLAGMHDEVKAWIRGLPPGTPERYVTERALRAIARQPIEKQVEPARRRETP